MTNNINDENLFFWIQEKKDEVVKKYLSEKGIDRKDKEQRTALINSAFYNNVNLLEWLLDNGADINMQDAIGFSALHFACQEGHLESVIILLKRKSNINLVDKYGNTAVWVTVMNWKGGRNLSVLKELYKCGADLTIKNNAGKAALDIIPCEILEQLKF